MSNLIADLNLGPISPPSDKFGAGIATRNDPTATLSSLESTISLAIGVLTVVAGIFFVIFFFLAAFKWQTAGGDAAKVQKARDEMVQGVIGMIIIVASYGIIGLIGTIIGVDFLEPGLVIRQMISPVFN
jgi:hypothetical protein